jgi:hypothetical protein
MGWTCGVRDKISHAAFFFPLEILLLIEMLQSRV